MRELSCSRTSVSHLQKKKQRNVRRKAQTNHQYSLFVKALLCWTRATDRITFGLCTWTKSFVWQTISSCGIQILSTNGLLIRNWLTVTHCAVHSTYVTILYCRWFLWPHGRGTLWTVSGQFWRKTEHMFGPQMKQFVLETTKLIQKR